MPCITMIPGWTYLGKNGVEYLYVGHGKWKREFWDDTKKLYETRNYDLTDKDWYCYIQVKRIDTAVRNGRLVPDLSESFEDKDHLTESLFQFRKTPIQMVKELGPSYHMPRKTNFEIKVNQNLDFPVFDGHTHLRLILERDD